MLKAQRADMIYEIIKELKYVTVEELVDRLHYSPATIRRDITYLANLGVVKKSYGGVSFNGARPMIVREHENTAGKIRVCNRGAEAINDGDMVFVDATTTTYFLCEALRKKKNVTVVTTNMKLATYLGEHKVRCIILGGTVYDTTMVVGPYPAEMAKRFLYDVAFFAPGGVNENGQISIDQNMWACHRVVEGNAKKKVLLCDANKFNYTVKVCYDDLSVYDTVVCDEPILQSLQEKFPSVEFVEA